MGGTYRRFQAANDVYSVVRSRVSWRAFPHKIILSQKVGPIFIHDLQQRWQFESAGVNRVIYGDFQLTRFVLLKAILLKFLLHLADSQLEMLTI